jgi:integrase
MASFELDKNSKLWSVRFRIINHGKEVNKRLRGFDTKKEAEKAYIEYKSTHVTNKYLDNPNDLTLQEVFNLYIEDAALRVKPSTLYVTQKDYTNFIAPVFGKKKLKDIKKRNIIDWQNDLTKKGYSYKYKMKVRGFFSAIYSFTVKYLDYSNNLISQCPTFARPATKKEMQVWSEEEFNKYIAVVSDSTYHALFNTLYYTGVRKGEALALAWEDVDLDNKKIRINKSITRKVTGSSYAITTPKNISSNRTIFIPDQLVEILRLYSKSTEHGKFIFGGDKPIAENTLTRYHKKYCATAGVKEIRIHDFRHSHASLLISRGASIVLIAKRLGHSSTEQTLNTYAHLMPNEEHKLVNLL